MPDSNDPLYVKSGFYPVFGRIAGIICIIAGSVVIAVRVLNVPILTVMSGGSAPMKADTALGFILTGISKYIISITGIKLSLKYIVVFCDATALGFFILVSSFLLLILLKRDSILNCCYYDRKIGSNTISLDVVFLTIRVF